MLILKTEFSLQTLILRAFVFSSILFYIATVSNVISSTSGILLGFLAFGVCMLLFVFVFILNPADKASLSLCTLLVMLDTSVGIC